MITDKFVVVEYYDGRRVGEVASGTFIVDELHPATSALQRATSKRREARAIARSAGMAKLAYSIERVTIREVVSQDAR